MRILWDLPLLQRGQVLHWKSGHKIGCKRKGRGFRAVQHPAHR
jgi:hypothetical protein